MPEWEYETVDVNGQNFRARQQYLNNYGAEGWELVSVDGGIAYFKRVKVSKNDGSLIEPR